MAMVLVMHGGEIVQAEEANYDAICQQLIAKHGPWQPGTSKIVRLNGDDAQEAPTPEAPKVYEPGQVNPEKAERIGALHDALKAAGFDVGDHRQAFKTGTTMLDEGVAQQAARKKEHEQRDTLRNVAAQVIARIEGEKRREQSITARDFAQKLSMNGVIRFDGYKLQDQAIKSLIARLESPALKYVFGVRDRIALEQQRVKHEKGSPLSEAFIKADKERLLSTLQYECLRNPDAEFVMRMRDGLGDIYAMVSDGYGIADAPLIVPDMLRVLDPSIKASWEYNEESTQWSVNAYVHTPIPAEQQAVGEPFEGYVSYSSRDNGTGRLNGGGGVTVIRCWNATIYVASAVEVSRVHRANILVDLEKLTRAATRGITILCDAWGVANTFVLDQPVVEDKLVPIELAIPGFYRSMLTARRGELVGVLPGRTETHVQGLSMAYMGERRNKEQITKGDLAQGYTRYIQGQDSDVQLAAEQAIGQWLVNNKRPVNYLAQ